jgi:hypothetical protein
MSDCLDVSLPFGSFVRACRRVRVRAETGSGGSGGGEAETAFFQLDSCVGARACVAERCVSFGINCSE